MNIFKILFSTVLLAFAASSVSFAIEAPPSMTNENYKYAVEDAKNPEPHEIYYNLIAIRKDNKDIILRAKKDNLQVRVITIIDNGTYKEYYKGKDFKNYSLRPDLWVTVEPELIEKIKKNKAQFNGTEEQNKMRIREIYGFPPDKKVDRVVVFWVDADNDHMFRPSPDSEIDDKKAEINFPNDVTTEHRKYINGLSSHQFFSGEEVWVSGGKIVGKELKDAYPWTQLGYSYDWGNRCDNIHNYGLSEFVVKGYKNWGNFHNIEIEEIVTLEDYIKSAKVENSNI